MALGAIVPLCLVGLSLQIRGILTDAIVDGVYTAFFILGKWNLLSSIKNVLFILEFQPGSH